jgi:hypothetical protein
MKTRIASPAIDAAILAWTRNAELVNGFWRRVEKTESCWNWTSGVSTSGYGRAYVCYLGERRFLFGAAHRMSYALAHGALPDGLLILHSCDNRRCVNPRHLRAGTSKDNINDAVVRGRWPKTTRRKLSDEQVRYIRASRGVVPCKQLAAMFGVTGAFVSRVQLGKAKVAVQ